MKEHLTSFDAEIKYTEEWRPKKQSKEDKFLMEELYEKNKSDKRLAAQLNRYRMAVHAITLTGVLDASGEVLTNQQLEGIRPQKRRSKIEWPTVGKIKKKDRKEWKNCISEMFCERGTNKLKKWKN